MRRLILLVLALFARQATAVVQAKLEAFDDFVQNDDLACLNGMDVGDQGFYLSRASVKRDGAHGMVVHNNWDGRETGGALVHGALTMSLFQDKMYVATDSREVSVFDQLHMKRFHLIETYKWPNFFKKNITGLTANGTHFFAVDDSNKIHILTKEFAVLGNVRVTYDKKPIGQLGELEWVNGFMFALHQGRNEMLVIDMNDGAVVAFSPLNQFTDKTSTPGCCFCGDKVASALGYNPERDLLMLGGRYWRFFYQIRISFRDRHGTVHHVGYRGGLNLDGSINEGDVVDNGMTHIKHTVHPGYAAPPTPSTQMPTTTDTVADDTQDADSSDDSDGTDTDSDNDSGNTDNDTDDANNEPAHATGSSSGTRYKLLGGLIAVVLIAGFMYAKKRNAQRSVARD